MNWAISNRFGKQDDTWILRMVAQSKGNSLPFTELKKNAKEIGKLTSIYYTVERLCPVNKDFQGGTLFCYNDLIRQTTMPDGEYEELLTKLKRRLKKSYNHFLQWQNWTKIKPHYRPEEKNGSKIITITIGSDRNNLIILRLDTKHNDEDKAVLIFRKKFNRQDDNSKYTYADKMILTFWHCGGINNDILSFKKTKNYITLKVPLIPKRKGDKLYFRTLAEESYYLKRLRYLDSALIDKGDRLVKSNEDRLLCLFNSSYLARNKQKIYKLREKISKIKIKKEYHTLNINTRGLLLYALEESNDDELNKSIENLARSDDYQAIKDSIYVYDEYAEKPEYPTISYYYQIKRNFPFLSDYNDLKTIFPVRYVTKQLRSVARELKSCLETTPREHIKYLVTRAFFDDTKPLLIQYIRDNNKSDNNISQVAKRYLTEIGTYLKHIEDKTLNEQHNDEMLQNVEHRQNLLVKKIKNIIERTQNAKEVIHFNELIIESKLQWYQYSSILKLIEERYRNKLVITEQCFVPGSKTKELKLLLKGNPTFDNALLALIENGVPKQCVNLDLIDKLGFTQAYEDDNDLNSNIVIVRKKK